MSIIPDEIRRQLKNIGLPYDATDGQIRNRILEIKRSEIRYKLKKKAEKLLNSLGRCPRWRVALPRDSQGRIIQGR